MPLILAGIDEAGYGPRLGPLCVGLSVFCIESWNAGDAAPDLWALLADAVCKEPRDARRRLAIADSKELKRPNTSAHPLEHLERGVRTMLALLDRAPACDASVFEALAVEPPAEAWYTSAKSTTLGINNGLIAIASNFLAGAMERAGVAPLDVRAIAMGEARFNSLVRDEGTKAAATCECIGQHLHRVLELARALTGEVRIVCDRQGGRTRYAEVLSELVPGSTIRVLEETEARSRYALRPPPNVLDREIIVQFQVEGEAAHLPVALASMAAKWVRELLMARFNAYWAAKLPALKPTAGYGLDSRRWLQDAKTVLTPELRGRLVRRA